MDFLSQETREALFHNWLSHLFGPTSKHSIDPIGLKLCLIGVRNEEIIINRRVIVIWFNVAIVGVGLEFFSLLLLLNKILVFIEYV